MTGALTTSSPVRIRPLRRHDIHRFVGFCIRQAKSSALFREAAEAKKNALRRRFSQVWGFLAETPEEIIGILESYPLFASATNIKGRHYVYLKCLWVTEEWCGRGVGKALMEAAEATWRRMSGVAVKAWRPLAVPEEQEHMPVQFFRVMGFREVAAHGPIVLMAKKFRPVPDPTLVLPKQASSKPSGGKVKVEYWSNELCPYSYYYGKMAQETSRLLPENVSACVQCVNTRRKALALARDGMDMELLLDGTNVLGTPMERKTLTEEIRKRCAEKRERR